MAEAQSQPEGSSARRRSGKTALGSECPGDGRIPGCGNPAVVYGPPGDYPYPAYYYPGYVPGMGLAFGTGLILGAAWANNWGNCNWGHRDITFNNNNNFNRNNINNINRGQQGGKWQHNA